MQLERHEASGTLLPRAESDQSDDPMVRNPPQHGEGAEVPVERDHDALVFLGPLQELLVAGITLEVGGREDLVARSNPLDYCIPGHAGVREDLHAALVSRGGSDFSPATARRA